MTLETIKVSMAELLTVSRHFSSKEKEVIRDLVTEIVCRHMNKLIEESSFSFINTNASMRQAIDAMLRELNNDNDCSDSQRSGPKDIRHNGRLG